MKLAIYCGKLLKLCRLRVKIHNTCTSADKENRLTQARKVKGCGSMDIHTKTKNKIKKQKNKNNEIKFTTRKNNSALLLKIYKVNVHLSGITSKKNVQDVCYLLGENSNRLQEITKIVCK